MGCDIHWCLEIKTASGWVGLLQSSGSTSRAADRNYRFFAELAGVRAYDDEVYPEPKGLPDDISALTRYAFSIGSWDHSHSWCSVDEFVAAYARACGKWQPPGEPLCKEKLFGFDYWPPNDEKARVVFAFDS